MRISKKTLASPPVVGPGGRPLFFNNVGLFSDPFLMDLSKNSNSRIKSHWRAEFDPSFIRDLKNEWVEKNHLFSKMSEAQLEEKWIRPILRKLGWEYEVQDRTQKWGKSEIPDYTLFESNAIYMKAQKAKTDDAYFEHVSAVADAKAMGIPLDGSKLTKANPSYQIVWYLKVTNRTWGILTDGRFWRLYNVNSKNQFTSYYEINIETLLREDDKTAFKYFTHFFSKSSFEKENGQSFLDIIFNNGEQYAVDVEIELQQRAFGVVEELANGFFLKSPSKLSARVDEVYQHSLYLLFRLMFVLNAEAKGLLRIDRQNSYYIYSLRALALDIKGQHDRGVEWTSGVNRTYIHLTSILFPLLMNGDKKIGINGFGQELFRGIDQSFFSDFKISDDVLNPIIIKLCFDSSDDDLKIIDYKKLNIDHMGSIFEGLLEHKLVFSSKKKCLEFIYSSKEKKDTGSFYTPDYAVDFIVRSTLGPIVKDKSIDEILSLKIMDPAMGSGHFLLGVIKYLEDVILSKLHDKGVKSKIDPKEVKWRVLYSCIYGGDINELAVELAKFSLWIYTADAERKIEPLGNNLFDADSLKMSPRFADLIDVFVGNPPYKVEYNDTYKKFLNSTFPSFALTQNVYSCFIEKVVDVTTGKPHKQFGFIIPNTFITGANFSELRKTLESCGKDISVLDFGARRIFENADVYTSVIFSQRTSGKSTVSYAKLPLSDAFDKVNSIQYSVVNTQNVNLGWTVESNFSKYFKLPKVESLFEVKDVGFNYWSEGRGKQRGGSIADRVLYEGARKHPKDLKYIKGRDIDKFSSKFSGRYLRFDWEEYLNQGDTFRFSKEYFDLEERIVYRQTSSQIIATIVNKGICNDKTIHLLKPKGNLVSLRLMLGYMNSSLFTSLYRSLVDEEGQAFAQVKTVKVKQLPVAIPTTKEERIISGKIENLVDGFLIGTFDEHSQSRLDSLVDSLYVLIAERTDASSSELQLVAEKAERAEKEVVEKSGAYKSKRAKRN